LYSALRENTANALNETQCHSNRCVFKSRRNWSGCGPATANDLSPRRVLVRGTAKCKRVGRP